MDIPAVLHRVTTAWSSARDHGPAEITCRVASEAGGPGVRTLVTAALGAAFLIRQKPRNAGFLVTAVGGTGLANVAVKHLVGRKRPNHIPFLSRGQSPSFPSGHASGSLALGGSVVYLGWGAIGGTARLAWSLATAGSVGLIGISRVKLGKHHTGDVVGGYALGAACVVLAIRLWRPKAGEQPLTP